MGHNEAKSLRKFPFRSYHLLQLLLLPLMLVLLGGVPGASSTRLRSDLPNYLSDHLLGLSVEPEPVMYEQFYTTDTITTTIPQITPATSSTPSPPAPIQGTTATATSQGSPTPSTTTATSSSTSPSSPEDSRTPSSSLSQVVLVSGSESSHWLPNTVSPLHYTIWVRPLLYGDLTMRGTVVIDLLVTRTTNNITLHITNMDLEVENIKLVSTEGDAEEGPVPVITHFTADIEHNLFTAQLSGPVKPGRKLTYTVPYIASIGSWGDGFFAVPYKEGDVQSMMLASMHQPSSARRAFPCFDEPQFKATFDLLVARQTNVTALSNMPLATSDPVPGEPGWVVDRFERTPLMSTYLLMLVISPFPYVEVTSKKGLPIRIWARPGILNATSYLQEVVVELMEYLEEYTDMPFPLPKLDLVGVPAGSSVAFEGWGLIQYYDDKKIAYEASEDSPHSRNSLALLTAHELAHQWFGNIVTPRSWSNIWLSEGIATYFHFAAGAHVLPDEEWVHLGPLRMLHMVLELDSRPSSHPILINRQQSTQEHLLFDTIEYHKGASLVRMMTYILTPDTFRAAIRSYLIDNQYDSVDQNALWTQLTVSGHRDGTLGHHLHMDQIMDTWTLQGGYPVVTIIRSPTGTSATVYQERFIVVSGNKTHDRHSRKWWIPLTYTTQEDPDFRDTRVRLWMRDTENQMRVNTLPGRDKWVLFNLQSSGYYRVNYDRENWRLLTQQLLTNHTVIHATNRAQLIDDAFELVLAGELDYRLALNVTSYLPREEEKLPQKTLLKNLERIEKFYKDPPHYTPIKKNVLSLLVPLYSTFKLGSEEDILKVQQYHAQLVRLTCHQHHRDCVHLASCLYHQWMDNPGNVKSIALDMRVRVFCTAIAHGGEAEWNFAFTQYMTASDPEYKRLLLEAMECNKESTGISVSDVAGWREGGGVLLEPLLSETSEGQHHQDHYKPHPPPSALTALYPHIHNMLGEGDTDLERIRGVIGGSPRTDVNPQRESSDSSPTI